MAPSPAPLAASPYRAPIALRPGRRPTQPPPWRAALLLSALVAGAVSTPRASIRRAAGDDPAPGVAVEHAQLLAGGSALCALTSMRDGTHQVVCAEVDEVTAGLDRHRVSHAWRSPALTQLVACATRETVALGLTAEGRVVRFARGGAEAGPVELPGLVGHGPITALSCGDVAHTTSWALYATTRDGALRGIDRRAVDAARGLAWTEVFPADAGGTRATPWLGEAPCAARSDGVWCVSPFAVAQEPPAPRERAFAGPSWVEIAGRFPWLCARDRAGRVACVRFEGGGEYVDAVSQPVALEGAPLLAEAIVGSTHDLCVRGSGSRWWCAAGPSRDEALPLDAARLAVHPEPSLDGAAEVALGAGSGCARWPDGDVRCWGRHLRGGSFVTRGPVEIPGARDASAVSVYGAGACARRRGEVWCWGSLGDAHPRRVELPGDAQALDAPYVAVGATVYVIQHGGHATALPDPRGDDAVVESIARAWDSVCVRRVDGHVTCWSVAPADDMDGRAAVHHEPQRVAALEGYARFAASHERVCAWDPGRVGRCWSHEVVAPPRAAPFTRRAVHDVPAHQLDAPTHVEGRCAVYPGGHRDCDEGDILAGLLGIPPPDWALDPDGDFTRLRRHAEARCDLLPDRRVACRVDHVGTTPRAPHYEYLPYWRVMPGLRDVRAVSATAGSNPQSPAWLGCAIRQDGRVFCWGTNLDDALTVGDSDRAPPLVPLRR